MLKSCGTLEGCSSFSVSESYGSGVSATLQGTASCSLNGVIIPGDGGYVQMGAWTWGGSAGGVSFEILVNV